MYKMTLALLACGAYVLSCSAMQPGLRPLQERLKVWQQYAPDLSQPSVDSVHKIGGQAETALIFRLYLFGSESENDCNSSERIGLMNVDWMVHLASMPDAVLMRLFNHKFYAAISALNSMATHLQVDAWVSRGLLTVEERAFTVERLQLLQGRIADFTTTILR